MVPTTRRRLLHATAAGLSALAGCGGSTRDDEPRPTERQPANAERNPETHVLRRAADEPAAWLRPADATTERDGPTTRPPENARPRGLVASADAADRLGFADGDGVEDARRFVDATRFDRETLYLETRRVGACFRPELCYVAWSETRVETQFGRYYWDADVACEVDDRDATAWLIRIPDTLDPEQVRRYGSGGSSRGCRDPPWLRETNESAPTATEGDR